MNKEVNINGMLEDETYGRCPYCGNPEPPIPGLKEAEEALEELRKTTKNFGEFCVKQQELFKDIPIDEWYEVDGKKYPFTANLQHMNQAYARCHFGVDTWWNEIHCCPKCKREYFTIHEH